MGLVRTFEPDVGQLTGHEFRTVYADLYTVRYNFNPAVAWWLVLQTPMYNTKYDFLYQEGEDMDVFYDDAEIQENVPRFTDIQRMREEAFVSFVIGDRSLDEIDTFLSVDLKAAGIDSYHAELTRQWEQGMGM